MRPARWLILLVFPACSSRPEVPALPPAPEETVSDTSAVAVVAVDTPQVSRDPARADEMVRRARIALQHGDTSLAGLYFEEAISADSAAVDAYWELGKLEQRRRHWDHAVAAWEALARIDSGHPELAMRLPVLLMRRDRADSLALLPPGAATLAPEEEPRPGTPVRIAAVGDIQLGQAWPPDAMRLPPNNATDVLAKVAPLLEDADITFGNLETVLGDSGTSRKCRKGARNCYAFRAPTAYARTLRESGFDVVSINNNHAADFQQEGRLSTMRALDSVGIAYSGPANGAASWESAGLRIALIAFSTGDGPYRVQDVAAAADSVAGIKLTHDLVIVSFHGGAEGAGATRVPKQVEHAYGEDRGNVFEFARAMIDAGADLVLGHGPHVLRGMEIYRGRLIAYSLGNFSSWHGFNLRGPLGISTVLYATLAPNGVLLEARLAPLYLERPGIPTPDPEQRAIHVVRSLSEADFGSPLFSETGKYMRRVP